MGHALLERPSVLPAANDIASPRAATEEEPAEKVYNLSTQQKLALLQMSSLPVHQMIWREMRKGYEAPPFTLSTFRQLRDVGLADLQDGERYHSLTFEGARVCTLVADALVAEHKIHKPWLGSNVAASATVHCTCGWSASVRRGEFTQANALRAFSSHLAWLAKKDDRAKIESLG